MNYFPHNLSGTRVLWPIKIRSIGIFIQKIEKNVACQLYVQCVMMLFRNELCCIFWRSIIVQSRNGHGFLWFQFLVLLISYLFVHVGLVCSHLSTDPSVICDRFMFLSSSLIYFKTAFWLLFSFRSSRSLGFKNMTRWMKNLILTDIMQFLKYLMRQNQWVLLPLFWRYAFLDFHTF